MAETTKIEKLKSDILDDFQTICETSIPGKWNEIRWFQPRIFALES